MSLNSNDLKQLEETAVSLAWSAGEILLTYFKQPLQVEYKGNITGDDPVTEADRQAEEHLTKKISQMFPEHGIVGEEGAGIGSISTKFTWVIDPLDGTTNFYNGLPLFACSIALLEDGVPVVGAIFIPWPSPANGRVVHAHKGGGTWDQRGKLAVSTENIPIPGRVAIAPNFIFGPFQAGKPLRMQPGDRRSVGSIAFELALVADGTYQFAVFPSPKSWDVAAGMLLVKEAGGVTLSLEPNSDRWTEFHRFSNIEEPGPPGQVTLREWKSSILVGNPKIASFVSSNLKRRKKRAALFWEQLKSFLKAKN